MTLMLTAAIGKVDRSRLSALPVVGFGPIRPAKIGVPVVTLKPVEKKAPEVIAPGAGDYQVILADDGVEVYDSRDATMPTVLRFGSAVTIAMAEAIATALGQARMEGFDEGVETGYDNGWYDGWSDSKKSRQEWASTH